MITTDKGTETRPATYQEMANLIDQSDEWAIGSLLALYQMQTLDEQNVQGTIHQNEVGFNACDAGFMSSLAQWYMTKGFLTDRQLSFVRKTLKKYVNQLLSLEVEPVTKNGKVIAPKPEPQALMKASLLTKKADGQPSGICVEFNFPKGDSRFTDILVKVKTLPDRRFEADSKSWRVGLSLEAGNKLQEWGFQFSESLQKWYDRLKPENVNHKKFDLDPRLYEYQKEGVAFIESRSGFALIADEQGLGKTCQVLTWLNLHPECRPVLIVCGASLKLNWEREIQMWVKSHNKTHIISGEKPYNLPPANFYIANYDILGNVPQKKIPNRERPDYEKEGWTYDRKSNEGNIWVIRPEGWITKLAEINLEATILDEIQKIKGDSQRTACCLYLAKFSKRRLGLSGTPLKNKALEIFNPIKFINPQIFPSFWRFTDDFTVKEHNGFGWTYKGVKNADKLHKQLTETIMIRRKKEEVLKDLPEKTRATVPLEIANQEEYDRIIQEFQEWLDKVWYIDATTEEIRYNYENPAAGMVEIEKLKQAVIAGKIDSVISWIEDFLESEKKLIIFACHTKTLDVLENKFQNICVRLDGGTSQAKRQKAINEFQRCSKCGVNRHEHHDAKLNPCSKWIPDMKKTLFLGNIIAAGEGINLTASSDVAFTEYTFVPGDHLQAEDRAHRIGQKDNVTAWYLVSAGTIEEKLACILQEKAKVLDQVLDGKGEEDKTAFDELIATIRERR